MTEAEFYRWRLALAEWVATLILAATGAALCLIPLGFVIVAVLAALGHLQDWWTPALSGTWAISTLGLFVYILRERSRSRGGMRWAQEVRDE